MQYFCVSIVNMRNMKIFERYNSIKIIPSVQWIPCCISGQCQHLESIDIYCCMLVKVIVYQYLCTSSRPKIEMCLWHFLLSVADYMYYEIHLYCMLPPLCHYRTRAEAWRPYRCRVVCCVMWEDRNCPPLMREKQHPQNSFPYASSWHRSQGCAGTGPAHCCEYSTCILSKN